MSNDTENSVDIDALNEEMTAAFGLDEDAELAEMAQALTRLGGIRSQAEREAKRLKKLIINKLDSAGLEAAVAGNRRLGFTTRTYYGVAEGESLGEREENVASMRKWIDEIAPEVNVPASQNIGKAVTAYLDANPEAELPSFVKVSETRSLTNRQA